jgi:catechol 2,3-dioxygenase-like lactoylglutathione lyase family enzyme
MPFEVHHYGVNVADLDRSLACYRDALGLEVVDRYQAGEPQAVLDGLDSSETEAASSEVALLSAGDVYLELVAYDRPRGDNANESLANDAVGRCHLCFTVTDMAAFYRDRAEDIEFVSRPVMTSTGGLMVKGYDPSGTLLEFLEPAETAPSKQDPLVDSLHHYGINTADVGAPEAFFGDGFGWTAKARIDTSGGADEYVSGLPPGRGAGQLVFLDAGSCEVELLSYPRADERTDDIAENDVGRTHLAVRVPDVGTASERLDSAVTFLSAPQDLENGAVGRKCRDARGYTIELVDPPTSST